MSQLFATQCGRPGVVTHQSNIPHCPCISSLQHNMEGQVSWHINPIFLIVHVSDPCTTIWKARCRDTSIQSSSLSMSQLFATQCGRPGVVTHQFNLPHCPCLSYLQHNVEGQVSWHVNPIFLIVHVSAICNTMWKARCRDTSIQYSSLSMYQLLATQYGRPGVVTHQSNIPHCPCIRSLHHNMEGQVSWHINPIFPFVHVSAPCNTIWKADVVTHQSNLPHCPCIRSLHHNMEGQMSWHINPIFPIVHVSDPCNTMWKARCRDTSIQSSPLSMYQILAPQYGRPDVVTPQSNLLHCPCISTLQHNVEGQVSWHINPICFIVHVWAPCHKMWKASGRYYEHSLSIHSAINFTKWLRRCCASIMSITTCY